MQEDKEDSWRFLEQTQQNSQVDNTLDSGKFEISEQMSELKPQKSTGRARKWG